MKVLHPPTNLDETFSAPTIFLAGSIEKGKAEPWQNLMIQEFDDIPGTIFNPRRARWPKAWNDDPLNPEFRRQVEWELAAQEKADLILMYFSPATKSPITLLELGLLARGGKIIACCPEGFWRRGNVEIVCQRFGIPTVPDFPALIEAGRRRLSRLHAAIHRST